MDRVSVNYRYLTILLGVVLLFGCEAKQSPNKVFGAGRSALSRGEFDQAIRILQQYLQDKPRGGLASRASFLIGKAYLGLGKYDQARQHFEQTIRSYSQSEEAHKSHYKLAVLSLLQNNREDARLRFSKIVNQPSGTLVPEATAMLRYLAPVNAEAEPGD